MNLTGVGAKQYDNMIYAGDEQFMCVMNNVWYRHRWTSDVVPGGIAGWQAGSQAQQRVPGRCARADWLFISDNMTYIACMTSYMLDTLRDRHTSLA